MADKEYSKEFQELWNKRPWRIKEYTDKDIAYEWFLKGISSTEQARSEVEPEVIASEQRSDLANGAVADVLNKLVDSLKWLMKEKEEELKEYKEYKYAKKKYMLKKEARIETVMECMMFVQTALRDYIKKNMKATATL